MEHDVRVTSRRIARVTMDHGVMEKVMRRDLETFFFFFIAIKCYSPGSVITCLLTSSSVGLAADEQFQTVNVDHTRHASMFFLGKH